MMCKTAAAGLLAFILALGCGEASSSPAKWTGVDEAVVEKFAREANRPPRDSWIGKENGDLLLCLFLLAGAGGGFVAGYFFRAVFTPRPRRDETRA